MNFLDDTIKNGFDIEYVILILIAAISLVAVLFCVIFIIKRNNMSKRVNLSIDSSRIYLINLKNGDYNYFQVNRLNSSLDSIIHNKEYNAITFQTERDFYSQFDKDDTIVMKQWIKDLSEEKENVPKSKTFYVFFSKTGKCALCLFEATLVSPKEEKIYLKSTILKNSRIYKAKDTAKFYKLKQENNPITKNEAIYYLKRNKFKGFTLTIKFYFVEEEFRKNPIPSQILARLFDLIRDFENNGEIKLIDENASSFLVMFFDNVTREKIEIYKSLVCRKFNQFLEINGFITKIGIACAATRNKFYAGKPQSLIDNSEILAEGVANNRISKLIFDTDAEARDLNANDVNFHTTNQIEKYISYTMEPLIKVGKKQVREWSYFTKTFLDTKNFKEVNFREKCEHDRTLDKLFCIPAKKIIGNFDNEVENMAYYGTSRVHLFYQVKYEDKDFFDLAFSSFEKSREISKGWNLVVTLSEDDLTRHMSDELPTFLTKLSDKYELALFVTNENEFKLSNNLMCLFSCFIFDIDGIELAKSEKENFNITSKAGKLTKYKKPIVVKGINSWVDVELLVEDGIEYLGGSVLRNKTEQMVLPVEKKIIDKISNFAYLN